jgi:hypothetical protein
VAQHRRQHDQAHSHRSGANDAGRRRKQRADDDGGKSETTTPRAEQPAHALEQVLGDARLLQHHAHEHEQRNRQQHRVCDDAVDAVGQRAENAEAHDAEKMPERGKGERHAGQRQRHWIAGHQRNDDGDDQQDGEGFSERHGTAIATGSPPTLRGKSTA